MPTAYGYVRVSSDPQAKSGLGLAAQAKLIEAHWRGTLRAKGVAWGGIHRDEAVSAARHKLPDRPGGKALMGCLAKGDHVIIAKVDRGFRSLADFAGCLDHWTKQGVAVHLLDLQVDTSTSVGRLVASIVAAVAEWESRRIGERIREAHAVTRSRGQACGAVAPLGFRLGPRGTLVADQGERDAMRAIVRLRRRGTTWNEIARLMAGRRLPRRKLPVQGTAWTHQRCIRLYEAAIRLHLVRDDRGQGRAPISFGRRPASTP